MAREKPGRKKEPTPKRGIAWPRWTGFRGMTVRDWLPIVGAFLIPVMIAGGTWGITWQQGKIEEQRAKAERELADHRAQDAALQAYFSQMGALLLEKDLRNTEPDSEMRTLARARTLTVLSRLAPNRKEAVMQFLVEAKLIRKVEGREPIIRLSGADLSGAHLSDLSGVSGAHLVDKVNLSGGSDLSSGSDLSGAILIEANLSGAHLSFADLADTKLRRANLRKADLHGADLIEADLIEADLSGADLSGAELRGAELIYADLHGADLRGAELAEASLIFAELADARLGRAYLWNADLSEADLSGADLSGAILTDSSLRDANLSGAILRNAKGVTGEQLEERTRTLEGATMPNGQKYEEWLKSKGSGEENSGPS